MEIGVLGPYGRLEMPLVALGEPSPGRGIATVHLLFMEEKAVMAMPLNMPKLNCLHVVRIICSLKINIFKNFCYYIHIIIIWFY